MSPRFRAQQTTLLRKLPGFQVSRHKLASRCSNATLVAQKALSGRRLQVAEDPVERLLVGIVVLPSAEVADVA